MAGKNKPSIEIGKYIKGEGLEVTIDGKKAVVNFWGTHGGTEKATYGLNLSFADGKIDFQNNYGKGTTGLLIRGEGNFPSSHDSAVIGSTLLRNGDFIRAHEAGVAEPGMAAGMPGSRLELSEAFAGAGKFAGQLEAASGMKADAAPKPGAVHKKAAFNN